MQQRKSLKISPIAKTDYRERLLANCLSKMKENRNKNFERLRMFNINDCDGIAREMLSDAIACMSSNSNIYSKSESVMNNSLISESIDELSEDSSHFLIEKNFNHQISPDRNESKLTDFDALELFLGSEDHQLLMDQISESLQNEYYQYLQTNLSPLKIDKNPIQNEDAELDIDMDLEESIYVINEEDNFETYIICPSCRDHPMVPNYSDFSLRCSCGFFFWLHHYIPKGTSTSTSTSSYSSSLFDSQNITVNNHHERQYEFVSALTKLKLKLGEIYDRHKVDCDAGYSSLRFQKDCLDRCTYFYCQSCGYVDTFL